MNMTSESATQGDYVELTCEVTYNGKWAPVIQWRRRTGDVIVSTHKVTERTRLGTEGTRLVVTQVNKLTPDNNRQAFLCEVFFDQPTPESVPPNAADNKPDGFKCWTQNVVVYCK